MEEKSVYIPTISCGHCVAAITRELSELEGVESVTGDAAGKTITVRWHDPADWDIIVHTLEEIGYAPEEK